MYLIILSIPFVLMAVFVGYFVVEVYMDFHRYYEPHLTPLERYIKNLKEPNYLIIVNFK